MVEIRGNWTLQFNIGQRDHPIWREWLKNLAHYMEVHKLVAGKLEERDPGLPSSTFLSDACVQSLDQDETNDLHSLASYFLFLII